MRAMPLMRAQRPHASGPHSTPASQRAPLQRGAGEQESEHCARSRGILAEARLHKLAVGSRLAGPAVDTLHQLALALDGHQLRDLALERPVRRGLPVLQQQ